MDERGLVLEPAGIAQHPASEVQWGGEREETQSASRCPVWGLVDSTALLRPGMWREAGSQEVAALSESSFPLDAEAAEDTESSSCKQRLLPPAPTHPTSAGPCRSQAQERFAE